MRVCHIGFSRYPGIGSVAMYEYTRNLAKLGVDVQVIATEETEKEEKEIDGVKVFYVKSPSVKNLSVYPLPFTQQSLLYLKKFPDSYFDIIHVYHYPGCFLFPLFLRNKGKKWIFFTTSGPIRGGFISKMGWSMQSYESHYFDHIILRDKSHIFTFSYRKNEDITIVPIGADLNYFSPGKSPMRKKYGIDPSTFLFLYAGNLSPLRRIETLIEGLKVVTKKTDAVLMLVGDGGTERLKKYAEAVGMKSRVYFTGGVPYTAVPSYMRCCNSFLSYVPVTPEFDIQPPLKTVEALACGLPVIATNTLGNRRFITHRENGLLTADDAVSLGHSMLELMENDALRKRLERNARPSVVEHDWGAIVKNKLLPAYERILG